MLRSTKNAIRFLLFPAPAQRPAPEAPYARPMPAEPPAMLATAAWAAALNSAYPCG